MSEEPREPNNEATNGKGLGGTAEILEFARKVPIPADVLRAQHSAAMQQRYAGFMPHEYPLPMPAKLVDGLIGATDSVLMIGKWSSGKSFQAIALTSAIATGERWLGREVDPGKVIYVAAEASQSIYERSLAWLLDHDKINASIVPFLVVPCAPNLLHSDEVEAFCRQMEIELARMGELPLRMMAFDTLHACAIGSKEDAEHTSLVLGSLKTIRERFGCSTLLVHHTGKDEEKGARGHSSLEGAADVTFKVVEKTTSVREVHFDKLRVGRKPDPEPFHIKEVSVSRDDKGRPYLVGVAEDGAAPGLDDNEVTNTRQPQWGATLSDAKRARMAEMVSQGATNAAIAETLGISRGTVLNIRRAMGSE